MQDYISVLPVISLSFFILKEKKMKKKDSIDNYKTINVSLELGKSIGFESALLYAVLKTWKKCQEGEYVDKTLGDDWFAVTIRELKTYTGFSGPKQRTLIQKLCSYSLIEISHDSMPERRVFKMKRKSKKVFTKKEEQKNEGYVYLVHTSLGLKIGHSKKPIQRLHYFQTKLPLDITHIDMYYVNDRFHVEKVLHEEFEAKLKKGEWYNLDAKDIEKAKYVIDNRFLGVEANYYNFQGDKKMRELSEEPPF